MVENPVSAIVMLVEKPGSAIDRAAVQSRIANRLHALLFNECRARVAFLVHIIREEDIDGAGSEVARIQLLIVCTSLDRDMSISYNACIGKR